MPKGSLYEIGTLTCTFNVSLRQTVYSHGWVQLAPWGWDSEQGILSRKELLADNEVVFLHLSQDTHKSFVLKADKDDLSASQIDILKRRASRWVSMEWNPTGAIRTASRLNRHIELYLKQGGGRFLRSSTFYEDLIKTICTINTNWASTIHMVQALVTQLGEGVFPNPTQVLNAGPEFLKEKARLGFRSDVVHRAAHFLIESDKVEEFGDQTGVKVSKEDLLDLKGLGPYSANHMMMLSLDFSSIPVDSEVSSYCKEWHGIDSDEIELFFEPWGQYKVLGYKLDRTLKSQRWVSALN